MMKGMKLFVDTNLSSHAITRYPTTKAIPVAAAVSANEKTFELSDDESAP
jgi:hypothetical protein